MFLIWFLHLQSAATQGVQNRSSSTSSTTFPIQNCKDHEMSEAGMPMWQI